jgi:hypothetical protein
MIESRLGKLVEKQADAVKKYNEEQIWTATIKGKIVTGTLAQLRVYREPSE